ncbi:MAG: autotransporter outer membrane beta-barrel domain-containing protein [Planctomycetaceae bacterium]|nr:autotransporter outer membrane beta-barrel domain-containing protein [Planctomycetaceae bacterium]
MRQYVRPLLALSLATLFGLGAHVYAATNHAGYATDTYGSQISFDSFNYSVRKRMESVRIGSIAQPFGRQPVNPDPYNYQVGSASFSSDEAYAMAPSSRVASSSAYRRRQLDCVYYSGFTVWADIYQTWAKQKDRGWNSDGYKFRTFGPAVGFDYTTGGFTFGLATTYSWGKIKSENYHHDRKIRTWATELYAQYNSDLFYVNGTLGYAHNSFRSSRNDTVAGFGHGDRYNSNAWNIDGEFGWKFDFSGFQVTPHAGLRWYNDRRGSISEGGGLYDINAGSKTYYTIELPVGVDLAYEINTGGMTLVPRARFAYVPELTRRRGSFSGTYWDGANRQNAGEGAATRNRHGFKAGLGMEARISNAISAHLDYNINFRSKQYEHHWNLGMGFTF